MKNKAISTKILIFAVSVLAIGGAVTVSIVHYKEKVNKLQENYQNLRKEKNSMKENLQKQLSEKTEKLEEKQEKINTLQEKIDSQKK